MDTKEYQVLRQRDKMSEVSLKAPTVIYNISNYCIAKYNMENIVLTGYFNIDIK